MSQGITYRVYLTPRTRRNVYGTEVEITDRVELRGLKDLVKSIDAGDYDVGVYSFSDVAVDCDNSDGYFADPFDPRSLFRYSRDLAKVRVVYFADDVETTTFRGLVNDEASRNEVNSDTLTLRILGRDSGIRKTKVLTGTVSNGMTIKAAITAILDRDEITSILTVDPANIEPDENGTVDDGSELNDMPTKEALEELLLVSNSVLMITDDDELVVTSREPTAVDVLELYGKGDLQGRENIISITNFNSGLHRMFNTISINDTVVSDENSLLNYGTRKKELTIDWLTDGGNITTLAQRVLREWKVPKIELEVTVASSLVKEAELLDRVSIDYPLLLRPAGPFLPIYGVTVYGDANSPYPFASGSVIISPALGFKIIEIRESPKDFTTQLKLRQIGVTETDGIL